MSRAPATSGPTTGRRRAEQGYDPEAVALAAANEERARREGRWRRETSGLRGAMGTPAQVRDYFRRYEECGVDQLILSCAAGRNRHEHIMETLELLGREILPEFVERDAQAEQRQGKRLAPVIETVLARKPTPTIRRSIPTTRSPPTRASMPTSEASSKFHRWLDDYADRVAAGEDVSKRLR